eukprot:TRINITY_DN9934_c0_g1_i4.p1 TRINITY_DN9934_c0_g1~~TRINITY_DN9934_c0_g1_i4.p1  ORF type:complete len:1562 (+),score=318.73 TRINITY_DN9934_c0_g1_i4:644-4687(+)
MFVPVSGIVVSFAHWHVTGRPVRSRNKLKIALSFVMWLIPIGTYYLVRLADQQESKNLNIYIGEHLLVCFLGLLYLLYCAELEVGMRLWPLTAVPLRKKVLRYFFWGTVLLIKFLFGLLVCRQIMKAVQLLRLVSPHASQLKDLAIFWTNLRANADILVWLLLWISTFLLFVSDTQLWFVVGCTLAGTLIVMAQRSCKVRKATCEDLLSKVPRRFSTKILPYAMLEEQLANGNWSKPPKFSSVFPFLWDRIVEYMRYEDKCSGFGKAQLSFQASPTRAKWHALSRPLQSGPNTSQPQLPARRVISLPVGQAGQAEDAEHLAIPEIFRRKPNCERFAKHYCCVPDPDLPDNADMTWRVFALARGLSLPMPRPYRAPYIPGMTSLIPQYSERVLLGKKDLFNEYLGDEVPLLDWLVHRYHDDFLNFTNRQQERSEENDIIWPKTGQQWAKYNDDHWQKITRWASMRMQTLFRTVAGICLYHPALQALYEAQGDIRSKLAHPGVWDPAEIVTCLVAMQQYKTSDADQIAATNVMFEKFPSCLKVAYIDDVLKGANQTLDRVHENQDCRYFSCLLDATCQQTPDGFRIPRYRIELPGFPILGDGKGDNQNHAIIFSRGSYIQCIDANQGAYFEQMLLLPTVLAELRTHETGDGRGKQIIGMPEHITSDIGSIGDFAASAEVAFGTLLNRTYAMLGARMHYGHSDIMNKQYMMQQGGVSKATKTLNLSEDIFAGMDFTLRGEGRFIRHCEYMHTAKGRDLGFNAVLGFFSKLSSGAGEQVITRQMYRLGNILDIPELLTWWYAHVGYYMTQYLMSIGMPVVVFVWLIVLVSDCETSYPSFDACLFKTSSMPMQEYSMPPLSHAVIAAQALTFWFSYVTIFFLIATSLPHFCQIWYEKSFKAAFSHALTHIVTLSPLLFIFQSKIIGSYVMNELRYGGATYVATGRSLPTERRPFIGRIDEDRGLGGCKLKSVGGLYLDYCHITMYDGAKLLAGIMLVLFQGGVSEAPQYGRSMFWLLFTVGLTIVSWLFAPFVFNPYQFDAMQFTEDVKAWFVFFWSDCGQNWITWWEKVQLKKGKTNHRFKTALLDISLFFMFFFFAAWFAVLNLRFDAVTRIFSHSMLIQVQHAWTLLPPVFGSMIFSLIITLIEIKLQARGQAREPTKLQASSQETSESDSEGFQQVRCLPNRLPLVVGAIWTVLLQLMEGTLSLGVVLHLSWYKTFVAAMVLKWALRDVTVWLAESFVRSHCFTGSGWFQQTCLHFVRSNRMCRDLLVSTFLLLALSPIVLITLLNDKYCPGCSWHELLIYRDTGHRKRLEAVVMKGNMQTRWLMQHPDFEDDEDDALPPVREEFDVP